MRSAVLVAIFLVLCQSAFADDYERESRLLESNIRDATACILSRMAAGMSECGVPSFAPLSIVEGDIDLAAIGLEGYLAVSSLVLEGIPSLYYSSLEGSLTIIPLGYKVKAKPVIDNIRLSTDYVLENFKAGDTEAYGTGDLKLFCQGLAIDLEVQIALTGDVIRSLETVTSIIACSEFEVHGINDDEALSQSINEKVLADAAGIIKELSPKINEVLVNFIMGYFNTRSTREISIDIECLVDGCFEL